MSDITLHPLRDVMAKLDLLTEQERVTVQDMLDAFGSTSFVPAIIVPALLVVSPLSGVPLLSTMCGVTIALIAVQMIVSRPRIWLPGFIMSRTIAGARLHVAIERVGRLADAMDRVSRDRLRFLVTAPGNRISHVLALTAGLAMPLLELVPFSSSILGLCVLCVAVGLLARDGLFVLVGAAFMALAGAIPVFVASRIIA